MKKCPKQPTDDDDDVYPDTSRLRRLRDTVLSSTSMRGSLRELCRLGMVTNSSSGDSVGMNSAAAKKSSLCRSDLLSMMMMLHQQNMCLIIIGSQFRPLPTKFLSNNTVAASLCHRVERERDICKRRRKRTHLR
jgi:hypothetical protein